MKKKPVVKMTEVYGHKMPESVFIAIRQEAILAAFTFMQGEFSKGLHGVFAANVIGTMKRSMENAIKEERSL